MRLAILDDYQRAALGLADWDSLGARVEVQSFHEWIGDEDALVERLSDFEIIVAMRERTRFPRTLLERLPKLKLLVTTGMRNVAIDVKAATELGILVTGTSLLTYPTAELTWVSSSHWREIFLSSIKRCAKAAGRPSWALA